MDIDFVFDTFCHTEQSLSSEYKAEMCENGKLYLLSSYMYSFHTGGAGIKRYINS